MREKLVAKYRYSWILLKELVKTDFKLRYQGSALGYLWALLKPLFIFVILYVVFIYFLRIQGGPHWPVAMLLGIVLWNFFAEVTNGSVMSIVGKGDILRKINFPKYIIVLASSISALINLLFCLIVIAIFSIFNGVELHWSALMSPLWILEIYIFGLGLGFILSTVFVKVRDINYIWEIIMQGLFYASAIIYPISYVLTNESISWAAKFLLLNPVAQAIQSIRYDLIDPSNATLWIIADGSLKWNIVPFIIVVLTFIFGALYFRKKSPSFAEDV